MAGHALACSVLPGAPACAAVGAGPASAAEALEHHWLCFSCTLAASQLHTSPLVSASIVGTWPYDGAVPFRCYQLPMGGSVPGGMSPLGGRSPELRGREQPCAGHRAHGERGRTSRRSAWLSTCRRLFLART